MFITPFKPCATGAGLFHVRVGRPVSVRDKVAAVTFFPLSAPTFDVTVCLTQGEAGNGLPVTECWLCRSQPFFELAAIGDWIMQMMKRTLAALVFSTAIAGGTYAFLGSPLVPAAQAHLKDHPKLERAYNALREAKEEVNAAGHDYRGHKTEALRN